MLLEQLKKDQEAVDQVREIVEAEEAEMKKETQIVQDYADVRDSSGLALQKRNRQHEWDNFGHLSSISQGKSMASDVIAGMSKRSGIGDTCSSNCNRVSTLTRKS